MPLIDPSLVPPRTTSLHHTFIKATTATMIRSFDSGEWKVEPHVLQKSQSMTGLRPRPSPSVTRLSRMGSFEDIARRVEIWGGKHDTVSAIAEHGWLSDGDDDADEDETPGRSSLEHEKSALISPLVPRKSSKRQQVAKRRGVSGFTRLLERRYVKEESAYDIFQKHLQSERTYAQNKKLGFELTTPGSKETPVMQTVLDQKQQEGVDRSKSKPLPPPLDFGVDGRAAEQVRRAQQKTKTKVDVSQPIPRDFVRSNGKARQGEAGGAEGLFNRVLASKDIAHRPGSAAAAVQEAQEETLGLARSARDPVTTKQKINRAAEKALSKEREQPSSFFEQGSSRNINIQPVLTKLKSIRKRQAQGSETGLSHSICRLNSKALTIKLKQTLNIHRRAGQEPAQDARVEPEAQSEAQIQERARVFNSEKRHLLHDIQIARLTKHQRWVDAESEMARAQDRTPDPIPPIRPISLHPDLESEAQIHAKALDAAFNSTPGTKWRSNTQITTIIESKPSGFFRIVGPPNHRILSLCNMWLDLGHSLRSKATNHMHQIEQGHLPTDHILSGCDCHLYRIYEALTNDKYRWIGIAQTQTQEEEIGRWVVYLAKENPISKYLMGSRMPSSNVPARRPTGANRPRPKSAMFISKQMRRKSRQGIFYVSKGLRDVGAT